VTAANPVSTGHQAKKSYLWPAHLHASVSLHYQTLFNYLLDQDAAQSAFGSWLQQLWGWAATLTLRDSHIGTRSWATTAIWAFNEVIMDQGRTAV
jgi:hypothetical protein